MTSDPYFEATLAAAATTALAWGDVSIANKTRSNISLLIV